MKHLNCIAANSGVRHCLAPSQANVPTQGPLTDPQSPLALLFPLYVAAIYKQVSSGDKNKEKEKQSFLAFLLWGSALY